MYLTFGGDIKLDTFEIQSDCYSWYKSNVAITEKRKKTFMSNHYYHMYKKKRVVGYICNGKGGV